MTILFCHTLLFSAVFCTHCHLILAIFCQSSHLFYTLYRHMHACQHISLLSATTPTHASNSHLNLSSEPRWFFIFIFLERRSSLETKIIWFIHRISLLQIKIHSQYLLGAHQGAVPVGSGVAFSFGACEVFVPW